MTEYYVLGELSLWLLKYRFNTDAKQSSTTHWTQSI